MKLSEAIRIGSLLTKPLYRSYLRKIGDEFFACAVGAAAFANGARDEVEAGGWAHTALDRDSSHVWCPVCPWEDRAVNVVMHLNDHHSWERPRIADWLESIGL